MKYSAIVKLEFSIHELANGKILPSAEKSGKSILIIDGESSEECMEKIGKIIDQNKFKILENKT